MAGFYLRQDDVEARKTDEREGARVVREHRQERASRREGRVEPAAHHRSVERVVRSARELPGSLGGRGKAALIIVGIVMFLCLMLYGPTRDWYVAMRRGQDLQRRYDSLAVEHETLTNDLERLQSRDGIEDEARRHGYVVKGETSVVVENMPELVDEGDGSARQDGEEVDDQGPLTKLLDIVFGYTVSL